MLSADVSLQDEKSQTLTSHISLETVRETAVLRSGAGGCSLVNVHRLFGCCCFSLFFSQSWINEFLMWEPEQFCGISTLQIPASMLWIPDIAMKEEYVLLFVSQRVKAKLTVTVTQCIHSWPLISLAAAQRLGHQLDLQQPAARRLLRRMGEEGGSPASHQHLQALTQPLPLRHAALQFHLQLLHLRW